MNRSIPSICLRSLLCAGVAVSMTACRSVITPTETGGVPESVSQRDRDFTIPTEAYRNLGYRMDWRGFPVIPAGERIERLDIFPDSLVVQESSSGVTVMEPANGSIRWATEPASRLTKFVGNTRVNDPRYGDVFVIASEAEVYLFAAQTGTLLSRQPFQKVVNAGTVTIGNSGIYGTATGELLCHQYSHGAKMWGVDASGSFEHSPVTVGSSIVAAVTTTGRILMVDMTVGRLIGVAQIFDGPGAELGSNDSILYVASLDQSLYAFLPTGSQLWRRRTSLPIRSQPIATPDTVYCTIDEGLTAFDAITGDTRWTAKDASGVVIGRRRANLLVWNGSTMFLVDEQRGDIVAREDLPNVQFIRMSQFEDGDMYVVSTTGVIAKFVTR